MHIKNLNVSNKIFISFILIIIVCITFLTAFLQTKKVPSDSPILDNYVKITSSKHNSDGTITVNYSVIKSYTNENIAPISIGYAFPPEYRLGTGFHKSKEIEYEKGNYSLTIPNPSISINASLSVYMELSSRYTETKGINSFSNTLEEKQK